MTPLRSQAVTCLHIRFLGTSAARPIPRWGCTCPQCAAAQTDPRARRTRSAILVNGEMLVDAGPDIYAQLGTLPYEHLARIDHIIITHPHADHYLGLDDLAALRRTSRLPVLPLYALADGWDRIESAFRHLIAAEVSQYDRRPFARREMCLNEPLHLTEGLCVTPLDTHHTQPFTTAGLLIEQKGVRVFYAPDFYHTDPVLVRPLDLAVLDGSFLTREQMDARYTPLLEEGQGRHMPIVEEARWAEEAGARRVIFTHIGHLRRTPEEVLSLLPDDRFALAYDGLTVGL
ncbi:MAG: MBL fold metallo-hydrolase [Anaerolineae bacterium]|nr:MBL fold metallo-hydrolase [Anaerolineae bacterium]